MLLVIDFVWVKMIWLNAGHVEERMMKVSDLRLLNDLIFKTLAY